MPLAQVAAYGQAFLPVLARASGLFAVAPVFGSRFIPTQVKVALTLVVSLILTPAVAALAPAAERTGSPGGLWSFALTTAGELAVGLVLGFIVLLLFLAVQVAGQLLDLEMGFGIINVIDPDLNQEASLVGNFFYLMAVLVFLSLNGHLVLLAGLLRSFSAVPVGSFALGGPLVSGATDAFAEMLASAVWIAAPVMGALFLTTVGLGLAARAVPQLNIFVFGLPVKAALGLLLLAGALPLAVSMMGRSLSGAERALSVLLGLMRR